MAILCFVLALQFLNPALNTEQKDGQANKDDGYGSDNHVYFTRTAHGIGHFNIGRLREYCGICEQEYEYREELLH